MTWPKLRGPLAGSIAGLVIATTGALVVPNVASARATISPSVNQSEMNQIEQNAQQFAYNPDQVGTDPTDLAQTLCSMVLTDLVSAGAANMTAEDRSISTAQAVNGLDLAVSWAGAPQACQKAVQNGDEIAGILGSLAAVGAIVWWVGTVVFEESVTVLAS